MINETTKGRHGSCATIQVLLKDGSHDGAITINEDDFDPKVHEMPGAESEGGGEETDFDSMTKKELQAWLDEHEVAYETDANKAALVELCKAQQQ